MGYSYKQQIGPNKWDKIGAAIQSAAGNALKGYQSFKTLEMQEGRLQLEKDEAERKRLEQEEFQKAYEELTSDLEKWSGKMRSRVPVQT